MDGETDHRNNTVLFTSYSVFSGEKKDLYIGNGRGNMVNKNLTS